MAITAGSGTPCLPASVTNPDLKLCAPKSPYKPASRARRFTIVASEPGRRGGPTRPFQTRLKIAPSWILAASSQDAKASALRLQVQQSRASEQHRALEKQLRQDIQAAQSAAAKASQSADILRGKCDVLEGQLSGLRNLPAQLEVALKRSKEVRPPAARRRPKQ